MTKSNSCLLKISCWNIQGLSGEKCNDKTLVGLICKYDCSIIVETWLNSSVNLCNQYTYCNMAQKSKRGRSKSGIFITMRNELRNGIKIIETNDHMVWLKLEKGFFYLELELYICPIYIPPADSEINKSNNDK